MKQNKNQKKSILFVVSFIFLSIVITVIAWSRQSQHRSLDSQIDKSDTTKPIIITATQDDTNAYELLKSSHDIDSLSYEDGVFIKGIDGVQNTEANAWAIKKDGVYVEQNIDTITLNQNDSLTILYVSKNLPLP